MNSFVNLAGWAANFGSRLQNFAGRAGISGARNFASAVGGGMKLLNGFNSAKRLISRYAMDGAGRYKRALENNVIPRTDTGDIIVGTLEKKGGL